MPTSVSSAARPLNATSADGKRPRATGGPQLMFVCASSTAPSETRVAVMKPVAASTAMARLPAVSDVAVRATALADTGTARNGE